LLRATVFGIEEYVSSFDLEPAKIYYSFLHNKIFWSSWFLTHGNVGFPSPKSPCLKNNNGERIRKYMMKGFNSESFIKIIKSNYFNLDTIQ